MGTLMFSNLADGENGYCTLVAVMSGKLPRIDDFKVGGRGDLAATS